MVQTSWPYDNAAVFEAQWREMGRLWLPSGPILGLLNQLEVFGDSTGLQVKVRTGEAWLEGAKYKNDAEVVLPIGSNSSGNPRIDRVVLRNDFVGNATTLAVLQGTPAGSPVPPALTQSATMHEISLAQVAVANGAATIAAGDVTDERHLINRYTGMLTRPKPAGQSFSSDITVNDDDFLFIAIGANEVWAFEALIRWTGSGGGLRYTFSAPSGASGGFSPPVGSAGGAEVAFGTELTLGAGSDRRQDVRGVVINGATPGFLRFRWAQNTSSATATTVQARSPLEARRLA